MNFLKNKIAVALVITVSLSTLTGCAQRPLMGQMPPGGMPVEAIQLKSSQVTQSDIYQAKLISRYSVNLQPQVAGQVANIYVKAGDHVKAGQLLMVIDKRKQEASLNSSRANVESAKATFYNYQAQTESLQSALNLNKSLYERYKALYANKSVSKQDLEKYTDAYIKAKADVKVNLAQIKAQKAEVAKAEFASNEQVVQLQYYKIAAPFSGIVGDIPAKVGSYVNTTTTLLSITQNNPLEINVGLPVEKVFDIHTGLPVEVLDNNGKTIGSSEISFVSPSVDTDTQTVLVKAVLKNNDGILKADQSVKARVVYKNAPGVLIPTNAISHMSGQDFAFLIVNKGKQMFVKQQPVKLGEIQGDKYIILSGLKAGDKIVSQGIQKLMDGFPVSIINKEGK